MELNITIDKIWGIGPAYAKLLKRMGIETARDLLFYFPRRYEDLSKIVPIGQITVGEVQSVVGRVMAIGGFRTPRKRRSLVEAVLGDETGMVKAVWFNQPYLAKAIKKEETIILSGKIEFGYKGVQFTNPVWERIPEEDVSAGKLTHAGRIVPIYSLTEGLTSRWLRTKIKPLLKLVTPHPSLLPQGEKENKEKPHSTRGEAELGVEKFGEKENKEKPHSTRGEAELGVEQFREKEKKEKPSPSIEGCSSHPSPLMGEGRVRVTLEDDLPGKLLDAEGLPGIVEAINQIHFPDTAESFEKARERFALEELLVMQLAVAKLKSMAEKEKAPVIKVDEGILKKFVDGLQFKLTNAQRKVAWEILKDLGRERPMTRLLEGDVGSGKTIVAALAILATVKAGYQVALMAPTGILAVQHYHNLGKLLEPLGVRIGLLTNEQTGLLKCDFNKDSVEVTLQQPERKRVIKGINSGSVDLVVGTHSLLNDDVHFENLALAIIDEQHRFGVEQRQALTQKTSRPEDQKTSWEEDQKTRRLVDQEEGSSRLVVQSSSRLSPHLLSVTATPIPRTLAMTVYGDLDLSVIDEMPVGRKKVISRVVSELNKQKAYDFVRSHVKAGNQVFVICPRIEEGLGEDVQSAKETFKKLSEQIFPELSVGLLHGRLKPAEKEKVMGDFAAGKISVLVSTSVVEVGVDVPNATIMWIEGAERFGLAQLHQLRGRVGRSDKQSFCLLFSPVNSEEITYRLNMFASCNDGFELAEEDMKMRGPGDLWGTKQSGFPELKIASLTDYAMVKKAKEWADRLAPGLESYPLLSQRVDDFLYNTHRE